MSGYNRDLQDTKKPLMEGLSLGVSSLRVATLLVGGLTPKPAAMRAALTPELFATHRVFELVAAGTPFREAYGVVGAAPTAGVADIDAALRQPGPQGSTSSLELKALRRAVAKERRSLATARHTFEAATAALLAN
jgi:argininosuccinate lyase